MKTFIIEDKQRIESIILHCDVCFVGIVDMEGNPYVVPMNFGYEDGIIYLHSGPEGSKVEMLNTIIMSVSLLVSDTSLSISTKKWLAVTVCVLKVRCDAEK